MTLPPDIQEIFFDALSGDKSLLEFEEWLYKDKRLEAILSQEDYLELISYGYKSDTAKKWLFPLFEKHIDKGEFEKRRIRNLLTKALNRDKDLPHILMTFYDMYCKGYYFMDNLGLGYGLAVAVPYSQANSWSELTIEQKNKLLDSFYPAIETEISKVISWLDNGKVVLTGIKDENDHFEYLDNRTGEEKKPTAFKVETVRTITKTESFHSQKESSAQKPWWKFW